jgi:23S rRNA (pseudouridine1915-N3)-methyltransferase
MIHINIICVGKLKENYLKDAINEYCKRLSKYCKLDIIEIADEQIPNNINDKISNNIKNIEGSKIINYLKNSYVISLDLKGKQYSSEDFSKKLEDISLFINSNITFIIGGSLGLSDEVLEKSNELICFSKMTFPHQLIRVFLLEQIFRAFKIQNNETYHR